MPTFIHLNAWRVAAALLAVLAVVLTRPATASERRVALVIGNSAYASGNSLDGIPLNDARDVTRQLERLDFTVVTGTDLSNEQMEGKVEEFRRRATGADVTLFFYSGHGAEVGGVNYLVPVDAQIEQEYQVKHHTLSLDQVLGAMDGAGGKLRLVILDCCRNNPFGRGFSRSTAAGLVMPSDIPEGTLIAFAAGSGKTAANSSGHNSPFSAALVSELSQRPDTEVGSLFMRVGASVKKATEGRQTPWVNSNLTESFVFSSHGGAAAAESSSSAAGASVADYASNAASTARPVYSTPAPPTPAYTPASVYATPAPTPPPETSRSRNFVNSSGITMVWIGDLSMWVADSETTQSAFAALLGSNPSEHPGDELPVDDVTWTEAKAFCARLNANESGRLPSGYRYRLPTDEEWSVFAAGTNLGESVTSSSGARRGPARVKSLSPNRYGLYDVRGNVWEWTESSYRASMNTAEARARFPGIDASGKVLRGGSWRSKGAILDVDMRGSNAPAMRDPTNGFRVVLGREP